jgi:4-hydroxybenzoate polyprenyltransferase
MILVRPRSWWFNKVPLSVTLVLLMLDGRRVSLGAVTVLALVVLTVCAVGNYGYALNELFDVEEDARLGRTNAAAVAGPRRMWGIIGLSAACAETFAALVAGAPGALLTLLALCLPLAYSVPPVRIKERKWLGVCADGLAAHVFPAMLALLAVTHWSLRPVSVALAVCAAIWSAAAGLRGILSHQLHTAEQDRGAGLTTVVHDYGNARVERFIVAVLLPLEVGGFGGALLACDAGPVLWCFVAAYALYELFKTASGRFQVSAFRPQGQRYVPFVEESFYKTWGPIALALDAARVDPLYLLALPAYVLLFRPLLRIEGHRLRSVIGSLPLGQRRT